MSMNNEFFVIVDLETKKFLRKTARGKPHYSYSHQYQVAGNPDERRLVVTKHWDTLWTSKIGEARIFSSTALAQGGYDLRRFEGWIDWDSRVKVQKYIAIPQHEHEEMLDELMELGDYAKDVV